MEKITIEDIKARLEQLKIFELRHTARAIGVERPTAYKRDALLVKIIAITSGTDTPVACESTVVKVIVNHTPYRCFARTGNERHDFNGVLPVEHIVYSVAAADFYRVYLVKVEVLCRAVNMGAGEVALILLVGYQVFYGYLLKMYVGDKSREIGHFKPPQLKIAIR